MQPDCVALAHHAGLSGSALDLLAALAECADDAGEASLTVGELAAKLGASERTVQAASKKLALVDLITIRNLGRGRGSRNTYRLTPAKKGEAPLPERVKPGAGKGEAKIGKGEALLLEAVALAADWRAEVAAMRAGGDADWLSWSPACRAAWAGQMLGLAHVEGFAGEIPPDALAWLADVGAHREAGAALGAAA